MVNSIQSLIVVHNILLIFIISLNHIINYHKSSIFWYSVKVIGDYCSLGFAVPDQRMGTPTNWNTDYNWIMPDIGTELAHIDGRKR